MPRTLGHEGGALARVLSHLRRHLIRHLLGLIVLLGLAWWVVSQGVGLPLALRTATAWTLPTGWSVEVGSVEGSWTSPIRAQDVTIDAPFGLLHVASISLTYVPRALLSRHVDVRRVEIDAPTMRIRPRSDHGSPSDGEGWSARDGDAALRVLLDASPPAGWRFDLRRLLVRDGYVGIQEDVAASGIHVAARAAWTRAGPRVEIDGAAADLKGPAASGSVPGGSGRATLVGRLVPDAVHLDELTLHAQRSRVRARGTVHSDGSGLPADVDFEVSAEPLDLRDFVADLPAPLAERPDGSVHMQVRGTVDSAVVTAAVEGWGGRSAGFDGRLGAVAAAGGSGDQRGDAPLLEGTVDLSVPLRDLVPEALGGTLAGRLDLQFTPPADAHVEGTLRRDPASGGDTGLAGRRLAADVTVDVGISHGPGDHGAARSAPRTEVGARLRSQGTGEVGRLWARASAGSAIWRVSLQPDSGRLRASGGARWGDGAPSVQIDTLALHGFDPASLTNRFPRGWLNGLASAAGRLEVEGQASGRADIRMSRSRLDGRVIDTAHVHASLAQSLLSGTLRARSPMGDLSGSFTADLADSVFEASVDTIRVPLGTVGDVTGTEATVGLSLEGEHLAGRVDAALTGPRGAHGVLRASVDAALRPSTIPTGRLDVGLRIGAMVDGEQGDADTLRLDIVSVRPGRFTLNGRLATSGGDSVRLEGAGRVRDDSWEVEGDLAGSVPAGSDILLGTRFDSITARVSAGTDSSGRPRGDANLVVLRAGWRDVVADTMRARLRVESSRIAVDTLLVRSVLGSVDAGGTFPYRDAGGMGDLQLEADVGDLEPLGASLGTELPTVGDGRVEIALSGRPDSLRLDARGRLGAWVQGRIRVRGVEADATATLVRTDTVTVRVTDLDAHGGLERIQLPAAEVASVRIDVEGGSESLHGRMSATVDDRRRGDLVVVVDPRPDRRTVRIDTVRLELDEDRWSLTRPALVSFREGLSVDHFLLVAGEQSMRVAGGVDSAGTLDLELEIDSTDVSTVTDLAGLPRLRGWLDGTVSLSGTTDDPRGSADLTAGLHARGASPTRVRMRVDAADGPASLDVEARDPTGGRLHLEGRVPRPAAERATAGGGALNVRLTADAFDLGSAAAFLEASTVSDVAGTLDADLTMAEPSGELDVDGSARIRGGAVGLPALGVRWDRIAVDARAEGGDLVIDSSQVAAGTGTLRATGTVGLRRGVDSKALQLTVALDEFRAIRNDAYEATVSGAADVTGTLRAPVVDGRLRVESLDAYLGARVGAEGPEDVPLTEEDLRMLRERFGYVPEAESDDGARPSRLTANLQVELGRDSWLRKRSRPEMAVPFFGSVAVRLRPDSAPRLDGTVETIAGRGFVEQFGKRFELREGTVTFSGPPASAELDLAATYTIPSHDNPDDAEATIVLGVQGTRDDLSFTLSSEPPMENADIVAYVATGRPASASVPLTASSTEDDSGGGLVSAGTNLALGQLEGLIESAARQGVGLDVVEIRREGFREATLVAGKYLSPRLYVGVAQPVSVPEGDGLSLGNEGESEVEVEFEALRWLLLNLEGSGSDVRFFLRGRHAY